MAQLFQYRYLMKACPTQRTLDASQLINYEFTHQPALLCSCSADIAATWVELKRLNSSNRCSTGRRNKMSVSTYSSLSTCCRSICNGRGGGCNIGGGRYTVVCLVVICDLGRSDLIWCGDFRRSVNSTLYNPHY